MRDQKLPIIVFSLYKRGALKRVVLGEDEGTLVHLQEDTAMDVAQIKKTAEDKMKKSIEALKADLAKVRTGRATPGCSTTSGSTITGSRCRSTRSPT